MAYRHREKDGMRQFKMGSLPQKEHPKVSRITLVYLTLEDPTGFRTDPACLPLSLPQYVYVPGCFFVCELALARLLPPPMAAVEGRKCKPPSEYSPIASASTDERHRDTPLYYCRQCNKSKIPCSVKLCRKGSARVRGNEMCVVSRFPPASKRWRCCGASSKSSSTP